MTIICHTDRAKSERKYLKNKKDFSTRANALGQNEKEIFRCATLTQNDKEKNSQNDKGRIIKMTIKKGLEKSSPFNFY